MVAESLFSGLFCSCRFNSVFLIALRHWAITPQLNPPAHGKFLRPNHIVESLDSSECAVNVVILHEEFGHAISAIRRLRAVIRIAEFRPPRSAQPRLFASAAKPAPVAAAPPIAAGSCGSRKAVGRQAGVGVAFTYVPSSQARQFLPELPIRAYHESRVAEMLPLEATAVTRQDSFAEARLSTYDAISP